jgi:predicted GTPase
MQFINLLTNDKNIRIGHDLHSLTFDVKMSSLDEAGRHVTLVDTPGFDDSREGVTDTDILGKIASFLQDK